jgi:hypothetical protein
LVGKLAKKQTRRLCLAASDPVRKWFGSSRGHADRDRSCGCGTKGLFHRGFPVFFSRLPQLWCLGGTTKEAKTTPNAGKDYSKRTAQVEFERPGKIETADQPNASPGDETR